MCSKSYQLRNKENSIIKIKNLAFNLLCFFGPYSATSLFPDNKNNWFTLFLWQLLRLSSRMYFDQTMILLHLQPLIEVVVERAENKATQNSCIWLQKPTILVLAVCTVIQAVLDFPSKWHQTFHTGQRV